MIKSIGPAYQRVADDLKAKISSDELPVGETIPSTSELMKQYDLSNTVIRTAVSRLRDEGIVMGHPGKGVYVLAKPEEAAKQRADTETLNRQLEELKAEVETLVGKVAKLQAHLCDLYARLGQPYPNDNPHTAETETERRHNTGT